MTIDAPASTEAQAERLLRSLAFATFIVFFQAYMVAPIIPQLATSFGASPQETGTIVPAYLIPYGAATLFYGLLADRVGLRPVMLSSLAAFVALTALTATAQSLGHVVMWRALTGLGAAGIVPLGLVLVGRVFPFERRGRPLGWLFGAMAGGSAFGSTVGALVEPWLGWQGLFLATSGAGALALVFVLRHSSLMARVAPPAAITPREVFAGYRDLLATPRGRRTYAYVFLNAVFHSGVFTWLGTYFQGHYGLGPTGVGLALLGYGIPGLLLGPVIGHIADRRGRARLLPLGLMIGAIAAAAFVPSTPLVVAAVAATFLSLGYDMTQPLFAGIVTSLGRRPGQAMGLNVFMLFVGFGVGSFLFGALLDSGWPWAFGVFAAGELLLGVIAFRFFRSEVPQRKESA